MPRYDNYRHDDRQRRDSRSGSTGAGKRVFWLFLGLGIAFFLSFRFAEKSSPSAPRPVRSMAGMKPTQLQEQATEQGILGGAKVVHELDVAAARAGVTQVSATLPNSPASDVAVRSELRLEKTKDGYRVRGARSEGIYVWPRDEEYAKADAIQVAKSRLAEELNGLTPEVEVIGEPRFERPSVAAQKQMAELGLEPDRGWAVLDVQTSEDAIRKERAKSRFGQVGVWVGIAFLSLLTAYGFLRLDMWTKGYLTTTLVVIAVVILTGGVIALVLG